MEVIIFLLLGAGIVWIAWKVRKESRALDKAALDEAWHKVLNDPNYIERRNYEERKRIARAAPVNR